MGPVYTCEKGVLYQGDCREVIKELPDASVDSVVTDPPAGIEFMGKQWDDPKAYETGFTKDGIGKGFLLPTKSSRNPTCINCGGEKRRRLAQPERQCTCDNPDFNEVSLRGVERDRFIDFMQEALAECLRVLKPGGHALVWSLPRTSHWTAIALENAGFEVRDCIYNLKDRSVEVQAFLDSLTPEQMELLLRAEPTNEFILNIFGSGFPKNLNISKGIDKLARGCGQGRPDPLSPLHNKYMHQKISGNTKYDLHGYMASLSQTEDNFIPTTGEAKKWSGWGTALKPAVECWWLVRKPLEGTVADNVLKHGVGGINIDGCRVPTDENLNGGAYAKDGSERYDGAENWRYKRLGGAGEFNQPTGRWPANLVLTHNSECKSNGCTPGCPVKEFPPFYYSAKASKSEKNKGLSEADLINKHPTVKNQDLMQYLVRLITPKNGTVLDPFAGSGSTLLAALSEGMSFVGIEQDPEYITIAKQRLATDGQTKLEEANQRDVFETMMNGEFDKD